MEHLTQQAVRAIKTAKVDDLKGTLQNIKDTQPSLLTCEEFERDLKCAVFSSRTLTLEERVVVIDTIVEFIPSFTPLIYSLHYANRALFEHYAPLVNDTEWCKLTKFIERHL